MQYLQHTLDSLRLGFKRTYTPAKQALAEEVLQAVQNEISRDILEQEIFLQATRLKAEIVSAQDSLNKTLERIGATPLPPEQLDDRARIALALVEHATQALLKPMSALDPYGKGYSAEVHLAAIKAVSYLGWAYLKGPSEGLPDKPDSN